MKQNFSNVGVAQVQTYILSLSSTEKNVQLHLIRTQFDSWMNLHFDLSNSQQDQLLMLPTTFKTDLAHQLANVWEQGGTVSFFKTTEATPKSEDPPRDKDILLQPVKRQQYNFDSNILTIVEELSIIIT